MIPPSLTRGLSDDQHRLGQLSHGESVETFRALQKSAAAGAAAEVAAGAAMTSGGAGSSDFQSDFKVIFKVIFKTPMC